MGPALSMCSCSFQSLKKKKIGLKDRTDLGGGYIKMFGGGVIREAKGKAFFHLLHFLKC